MARTKSLVALAVIAVVASLTVSAAHADTVNGTLNLPNAALSAFAGPYGTVQLDLVNSSQIHVVFTAAAGYQFVDGGSVGLSLLCGATSGLCASSVSVTGVSVVGGNPIDDIYVGNPQNNDGVGQYELQLSQKNASDGVTMVTFDINRLSGALWTEVRSILDAPDESNPGNSWVSAHISVNSPCTGACTGFTGGNVTTQTPEPGTLALLGIGMVTIGTVARRLRKR